MTDFPLIAVTGTASERGEQYGRHARGLIESSLERYRMLYGLSGVSWERACGLALDCRGPLQAFRPGILEELDGIARGVGVGAEEILALNLRTEIINSAQVLAESAASGVGECTSLAISAECSADGRTIVAQNWDYMEGSRESTIVLQAEPSEGQSFITVVEAGLLAKMGMNAAGVALVTNGLATHRDLGRPGVPYHAILRAILECGSLAEVRAAVAPAVRSASGNFLVSDGQGAVVDFETWAGSEESFELEPTGGTIAHTNHCLVVPDGKGEVPFELAASSESRLERTRELLAQGGSEIAVQDVERILSDHEGYPYSVCTHVNPEDSPLDRAPTSASLVMVPQTRTMLLAAGNPCTQPYESIDTSCLSAR